MNEKKVIFICLLFLNVFTSYCQTLKKENDSIHRSKLKNVKESKVRDLAISDMKNGFFIIYLSSDTGFIFNDVQKNGLKEKYGISIVNLNVFDTSGISRIVDKYNDAVLDSLDKKKEGTYNRITSDLELFYYKNLETIPLSKKDFIHLDSISIVLKAERDFELGYIYIYIISDKNTLNNINNNDIEKINSAFGVTVLKIDSDQEYENKVVDYNSIIINSMIKRKQDNLWGKKINKKISELLKSK